MTASRRLRHLTHLTLLTLVIALLFGASATAQSTVKRALTHDDYDGWTSLRNPTYSKDGKWMAYTIAPRVGDGMLHIRQVDGDKSYEFARGRGATFSDDNRFVVFRVAKSYKEERRRKLEKLYAEKEEAEEVSSEEEAGIPPDIREALVERGISMRAARRMKSQRGANWNEVRSFLGLPEVESKKKPAKPRGKKKKKSKEEEEAEKKVKALQKRLHVLDLGTGETNEIERVKSFRLPEGSTLLVMLFEKPEAKKEKKKEERKEEKGEEEAAQKEEPAKEKPAKKEGEEKQGEEEKEKEKDPKEAKRSDGTRMVLRDLSSGDETLIEHVRSYGLLADDAWLWYTVGTKKEKEGVEHGLFARELATGRTVEVLAGYSNISGMTSDHDDSKLVFTSDLRQFGEEDADRDIYLWDFSDAPARLIVGTETPGLPEGMRIQASGLGFSYDASVVTFGVKPPKKKKLPKILPEDEVKLDLWNWRDGLLQPMQAKRGDPTQATRTAVYHLDAERAVVLGTETVPSVSLLTDDGSRALASDKSPYEKLLTWDGRYSDYYIINTIDGSRTKIIESLRGSAQRSSGGNFVLWFDSRDYDWHVYDVNRERERNLTASIDAAFDRQTDDRPQPNGAHGTGGWTDNDGEVLLYDEFDIWAVDPVTGASRCVTDGFGRATHTRLRVSNVDLRPDAQRDDDEERRFVAETLVLAATDVETYATGYFTDSLHATGRPHKLVMKDCAVGRPTRPEDADRLFLTFSRWDQFPDIWTCDLAFEGERKLTDACPQRREVRWGSAELVRWRSNDGVELKGYLVKPDGFDPSQRYPMMVYFYERSSQNIHRFVSPRPGTSPNAAFYVSNGYVWFVPDIVYREGFPGESCEKCVVSGVQHILSMGFIDPEAIGVAGHSWGGYQTAHLITRTDLFAAAESGAPVVDMFSAYGGIRWGSGMSRQFQYEKTQSRIGGSIWEYPMRYWENSPLFFLDKVETPVLILHNDKDGAVPWYQGIEFFVALRRLGKEAYLANYNGEDHGLRKRQNQRDWTRRMQEFFDHHLKGAPAPDWMKKGIPYHDRMAEKIPNAPSYREAVRLGLIETEEKKTPESEATLQTTGADPKR